MGTAPRQYQGTCRKALGWGKKGGTVLPGRASEQPFAPAGIDPGSTIPWARGAGVGAWQGLGDRVGDRGGVLGTGWPQDPPNPPLSTRGGAQ